LKYLLVERMNGRFENFELPGDHPGIAAMTGSDDPCTLSPPVAGTEKKQSRCAYFTSFR
jgi:hypothetical protein